MDSSEILKSLGRIEATQEHMKSDIADIKEGVADYRKLKHNLIGACVVISSVAGWMWNLLLRKIGGDA
jgi:hypothetical protein